jgi:putative transcriptional regulator
MIRHHPSDTTLLRAAAGFLPEPHRRVLAVHLATCSACSGRLRELQAVGGGLMDMLPPAKLADDALARTLARLDEAPPPGQRAPCPAPVTLEALATGQWRWLGPGIARMALISRDETDSRLDLLRVAPDVPLPAHGHADFETTVVLQGAFEDNDFNYAIGDFIEADAETDHAPRALKEESCICLIATTGRLQPRNWLLRLLQPLSLM